MADAFRAAGIRDVEDVHVGPRTAGKQRAASSHDRVRGLEGPKPQRQAAGRSTGSVAAESAVPSSEQAGAKGPDGSYRRKQKALKRGQRGADSAKGSARKANQRGRARSDETGPVRIGVAPLTPQKPTKRPIAKRAAPLTTLTVQPDARISPAVLAVDESHRHRPIADSSAGTAPSVSADEVEFIVGLDFGTRYCKVVVREPASGRAWAVPLSQSRDNPYLLSTWIWERDGMLSLAAADGRPLPDLKLRLIQRAPSSEAVEEATAFIALVLQHVKAWFWRQIAREYPSQTPFWVVHLGLPVENLSQSPAKGRFEKALWSALALSEECANQLGRVAVRRALVDADLALARGHQEIAHPGLPPVHRDQTGVFPEVVAQIYGYLQSDQRDPALELFMLADIGGGTVDSSLFRVVKDVDGEELFVFYSATVRPLGVYLLHQARLEWHLDQLHKMVNAGDRLAQEFKQLLHQAQAPSHVPGQAEDYLIGATYPDQTCDHAFSNEFGATLYDKVYLAAKENLPFTQRYGQKIPFLLCGGGRSIEVYQHFVRRINSPWSPTSLSLHQLQLPRPSELQPGAITANDFHRLSVAYGLSFADIGRVTTPDQLTPVKHPDPQRYRHSYASKDVC